MIEIIVPGFKKFCLNHLVLDFNGTLACDGKLLPGVHERLERLARDLKIHILTADTFGTASEALHEIPCSMVVVPDTDQAEAKGKYVYDLGGDGVVAVGNGRNDRLMLQNAILGIAVIQEEGAFWNTLLAAQVVAPDINCALDLLIHPKRLVATLRD